ncbi:MAG TPA: M20/M25/M40 family metallo-hydrolase [Gemmatimonadales bacterium]
MTRRAAVLAAGLLAAALPLSAQTFPVQDATLSRMWALGMDSSHAWELAQTLTDSIGPRLNGSPGHKAGNDWLVAMYRQWGIEARNEQYGTWRGWDRGVTHLDLVRPRVRSLEAMLLAWSAGTGGRNVEAAVVTVPDVADSAAFLAWLPSAKGKFVLASMPQMTCRADANIKEFATPEVYEKIGKERQDERTAWAERMRRTGLNTAAMHDALARAGARGILTSNWSNGWGVQKIFGTRVEGVPVADVSCEDYGLLWRLAEQEQGPVVRLRADARALGEVPVFNTIATIPGTEKPDEYVMLSAHFDSWDGSSGATDNATGTVTMLEAMRILREAYPRPKRTIVVGHWGGEEQGLNGSRAFFADHPEIVRGLQVLLNQDNGTGRVTNISMSGFVNAGGHFGRWLARIPTEITRHIDLNAPGNPPGGGSDMASAVCHGAPGISLSSISWDYGTYTWHTNRDTFDKIMFDEIRNNATLTAMLAYLAAEDPEMIPRERRVMPVGRNGQQTEWPSCPSPARASTESTR